MLPTVKPGQRGYVPKKQRVDLAPSVFVHGYGGWHVLATVEPLRTICGMGFGGVLPTHGAHDMPDADPAARLTRALVQHREDALEWEGHGGRTYYSRINRFDVDYAPGMELRGVSEAAGLKPSIWPWKSNLYMSSYYVEVGVGYGAPRRYYYPLDDGRVLKGPYPIPEQTLSWIVDRLAEGATPPVELEILDWNWRAYAESIGALTKEG